MREEREHCAVHSRSNIWQSIVQAGAPPCFLQVMLLVRIRTRATYTDVGTHTIKTTLCCPALSVMTMRGARLRVLGDCVGAFDPIPSPRFSSQFPLNLLFLVQYTSLPPHM